MIDTFFQTQPYLSAFVTCSFKASAADLAAQFKQQQRTKQQQEEKGRRDGHDVAGSESSALLAPSSSSTKVPTGDAGKIDVSRNLAFVAYGGLYQGLFQEFLYNDVFPKWFDDDNRNGNDMFLLGDDVAFAHQQQVDICWRTLASQVGIDMLLITPLLCLPLAYVFAAAASDEFGRSGDGSDADAGCTAPTAAPPFGVDVPSGLFVRGVRKYVDDCRNRALLAKCWALWVPVKTLTFSVVPRHYRVAFIAAVSFFWVFFLSSVSSSSSSRYDTTTDSSAPTAEAALSPSSSSSA